MTVVGIMLLMGTYFVCIYYYSLCFKLVPSLRHRATGA